MVKVRIVYESEDYKNSGIEEETDLDITKEEEKGISKFINSLEDNIPMDARISSITLLNDEYYNSLKKLNTDTEIKSKIFCNK